MALEDGVASTLKALVSDDSAMRAAARRTIREHPVDWRSKCLDALDSDDPVVRSAAISSLQDLKLPIDAVARAVRHALHDSEGFVRATAGWICASDPAVAKQCMTDLRALAADDYWHARQSAADALAVGWSAEVETLNQIAALLADTNSNVRSAAAEAVGVACSAVKPMIKRLVTSCADPDWEVRRSVVRSIQQFVDETQTVVPTLLAALDDEHFDVREEAAGALGSVGAGALPAVPKLVAQLSYSVETLRRAARSALAAIGTPATRVIGERFAMSPACARAELTQVVCEIASADDADALALLVKARSDSAPLVRARALEAIQKLFVEGHFNRLLQELTADCGEASALAARALARLTVTAKQIERELVTAMGSNDEATRLTAALGLTRMRSSDPSYIAGLLHMLEDGRGNEKLAAARLVGCVRPPTSEIIAALAVKASNGNPQIRLASIRSLGHTANTTDPAFQSLVRLCRFEQDGDVRLEAERAVRRIRRRSSKPRSGGGQRGKGDKGAHA